MAVETEYPLLEKNEKNVFSASYPTLQQFTAKPLRYFSFRCCAS